MTTILDTKTDVDQFGSPPFPSVPSLPRWSSGSLWRGSLRQEKQVDFTFQLDSIYYNHKYRCLTSGLSGLEPGLSRSTPTMDLMVCKSCVNHVLFHKSIACFLFSVDKRGKKIKSSSIQSIRCKHLTHLSPKCTLRSSVFSTHVHEQT